MKLVPALVMLLLVMSVATQAQTYWLGKLEGDEISFEVQVPADAVKIILYKDKAPNRGNDTAPRYRTFTQTINGKTIRFHSNELAWETPKLKDGDLTWMVDAGMGAHWLSCNTKDPLWNDFADTLAALATNANGWSHAKVIIAESKDKTAPTAKLNRDGSVGKPSAEKTALWRLAEMNSKGSLSEEELNEVRDYMLTIINAGRANPNYRREMGSKTALNLPTGLKPLEMNEFFNKAAQLHADYCARTKQVTHDQDDEKYATVELRMKAVGYDKGAFEAAGAGSLQDYPTAWMKSETHYRPWWNLDNEIVTLVGFGVAKGDNGTWYFVAVIGN